MDAIAMPGYRLLASPTLHPGQLLRAAVRLAGDATGSVQVRLTIGHYTGDDRLASLHGPATALTPGGDARLAWWTPDTGGQPIAEVGVEVSGAASGALHLDWLTWDGAPTAVLGRPSVGGTMWRQAWVDGVDIWPAHWPEPYRISQNRGIGLISQGSLDWTDYRVEADVTPRMAAGAGVAARVRGLRRYYALMLAGGGRARLMRVYDESSILADVEFAWDSFRTYGMALEVVGDRVSASIDGSEIASVVDPSGYALRSGAIGLVCEEGTMASNEVRVMATALHEVVAIIAQP